MNLNLGNQVQFAHLLQWFLAHSNFSTFLSLFDDEIVKIYDYSFITSAIKVKEPHTYEIWNIQDPIQTQKGSFARRYLYSPQIDKILPKSRDRKKLYRSVSQKSIEIKSDEMEGVIENARQDCADPERSALIIQAFVDDIYPLRNLGKPPEVRAQVLRTTDGSQNTINWNINLDQLSELAGKELGFHKGAPLAAGAIANRLLWSAAKMSADLYLSKPMSILVGDKLYEAASRIDKSNEIIQNLKLTVDFPDIRNLVNQGIIPFQDILKIRKKAKKFREWIQQESDRDRDAIIAYHNEVAKESGFKTAARSSLTLFGILGGALGGAYIGNQVAGSNGQTIGTIFGTSLGYLTDISAKLGSEWKPLVFGNWLRDRIERYTKK